MKKTKFQFKWWYLILIALAIYGVMNYTKLGGTQSVVGESYTLKASAMDSSNNLLSPSTIIVNGATYTGNPYVYPDVLVNIPITVKYSSAGYKSNIISYIFDSKINSCAPASSPCTVTSTISGTTYTTTCTYFSASNAWICSLNTGYSFTYWPSSNGVEIKTNLVAGSDDTDGDGNPDNTDVCPNDATNNCFTIYTFKTTAVDYTSGYDLNPSTIIINGVSYTATPTRYVDIPVNTIVTTKHSSAGYKSSTGSYFLDNKIHSCNPAITPCTMTSTISGTTYTTTCTYFSASNAWTCTLNTGSSFNYYPASNGIEVKKGLVIGSDDSDSDGNPDSTDSCPNDATNKCLEPSIVVAPYNAASANFKITVVNTGNVKTTFKVTSINIGTTNYPISSTYLKTTKDLDGFTLNPGATDYFTIWVDKIDTLTLNQNYAFSGTVRANATGITTKTDPYSLTIRRG